MNGGINVVPLPASTYTGETGLVKSQSVADNMTPTVPAAQPTRPAQPTEMEPLTRPLPARHVVSAVPTSLDPSIDVEQAEGQAHYDGLTALVVALGLGWLALR